MTRWTRRLAGMMAVGLGLAGCPAAQVGTITGPGTLEAALGGQSPGSIDALSPDPNALGSSTGAATERTNDATTDAATGSATLASTTTPAGSLPTSSIPAPRPPNEAATARASTPEQIKVSELDPKNDSGRNQVLVLGGIAGALLVAGVGRRLFRR